MGKIRGDRRSARALAAVVVLSVLSVTFIAAPPSSAAPAVVSAAAPAVPPGNGFHPLAPSRIADSRRSLGLDGALGARESATLDVLGAGGVPAAGVSAVALNVTVVASAPTHVTLWPAGGTRPATSNVNASPATPVANLVFVEVGAGGRVSVSNNAGESHVIVDVVGWFADGPGGGRMHTVVGERVLDTRRSAGPVGPGGAVEVDVTGVGGVPATDVSAVLLNVVAVDPTTPTHLTVWPTGAAAPFASTLNTAPGAAISNLAVVAPGAGGSVSVRNASGSTQVVVDVVGWVDSAGGGGGGFIPVAPARLFDSRASGGGPFASAEQREVEALGRSGVPSTGVAALVVNVTGVAAGSGQPSHLTTSTPGSSRPPLSTVNTPPGRTVARLALVSPGTAGRIAACSSAGHGAVVIDVVGYIEAAVDLDEAVKVDADRCDMLAPTVCMLPFPSDRYTVPDATTGTGLRVSFDERAVPANKDGVAIDPSIFDGNDGFSPGSSWLLHLPQVDLAASGAPPLTDIEASLAADSPIVLLDATTGERHPFWAELDQQAVDPANRNLIVQPATNPDRGAPLRRGDAGSRRHRG